MPLDGFGRRIDYLRISLIDECNLRCVYCMDPDDRGRLGGDALLDAREIGVVAHAAASLGFGVSSEPLFACALGVGVAAALDETAEPFPFPPSLHAEATAASRSQAIVSLTGRLIRLALPHARAPAPIPCADARCLRPRYVRQAYTVRLWYR